MQVSHMFVEIVLPSSQIRLQNLQKGGNLSTSLSCIISALFSNHNFHLLSKHDLHVGKAHQKFKHEALILQALLGAKEVNWKYEL